MNLFLDVASKNPSEKGKNFKTPIWFMRQAGRYLPEYREIRQKAGSFLDLCYNPVLASEVTLQPIKRFGFDAAIIFSDILVVPHAMGVKLDFIENYGPKIEQISSFEDLEKLKVQNPKESKEFLKIYEAVSITRSNLEKNKALIGFAGSPWTVATYMVGRKKHDFDFCRKICYENPLFMDKLISKLIEQTKLYLEEKIKAGADAIQLFDSWAGVLTPDLYKKYVIKPNQEIVKYLKTKFPKIPVICFPRASGVLYENFVEEVEADVIGIDYFLPFSFIKNLQKLKIVQGNLDPLVLFKSKDGIKDSIDDIMQNLSEKDFIFNLGHGIVPETPIENVEFLVDYVRKY